jgi:hypothetical protein
MIIWEKRKQIKKHYDEYPMKNNENQNVIVYGLIELISSSNLRTIFSIKRLI